MAGTIATFLGDIKTALETAGNFNRVWIAPFLDVEALIKIPRLPAALIVDKGGALDRYTGEIWSRSFSVSVIDAHPRDHIGEETTKQILDLGEAVLSALAYGTPYAVFHAGDNDLEAVGTESGMLILVKTFNFSATLEG